MHNTFWCMLSYVSARHAHSTPSTGSLWPCSATVAAERRLCWDLRSPGCYAVWNASLSPTFRPQSDPRRWDRQVLPKRRQQPGIPRCVTSQKIADVIQTAVQAWNDAQTFATLQTDCRGLYSTTLQLHYQWSINTYRVSHSLPNTAFL